MIGLRLIASLALLVLIAGAPLQAQSVSEDEPEVPFRHAFGLEKFQSMCAQCHGQWANGTDKGPPLIHGYYVPSHHSDEAFYRAILQGSPMHHWTFGDMPPVSGATTQDAQNITGFLRWLQQYQGLYQGS